jgi:hypothetical protein
MIFSHPAPDPAARETGPRALLEAVRVLALLGNRAALDTLRATLHTKPRDADTAICASPAARLHLVGGNADRDRSWLTRAVAECLRRSRRRI